MIGRFLDPKNDYAFKQIFGEEKNKEILIKLLNAVLGKQFHKQIVEVAFLNPIQEPEVLAKKQSIVDVLCRDQDGCQYIIEMQMANTSGFEERAQYYAYKAFVSQIGAGQTYYGLKEVIFLAFTNFAIFPEKAHYKSEHVTLDKKTKEHNLDKISFTFVDLTKFKTQLQGKSVDQLPLEEKFYYFLCHAASISSSERVLLTDEEPAFQQAFNVLERIALNEKEKVIYDQAEKRERDLIASYDFAEQVGEKRGIEKGRKEGIEKGRKEGEKRGIEKGRKEGIEKGRKEGEKRGIEKGKKAIEALLASGAITQEQAQKAMEKL